jgi:hypothetical protein
MTAPADDPRAVIDRLAGMVSVQTLVGLVGSPFAVLSRLVSADDADEITVTLSTVAAVVPHLREAGEHRAAAAYERVCRHWLVHELRRWGEDDDDR